MSTYHCPKCEAAARERDDLRTRLADIEGVLLGMRGETRTGQVIERLWNAEARMGLELADLRTGILRIIEDYPRDIRRDAEEALRALAAGETHAGDLRARLAALRTLFKMPYHDGLTGKGMILYMADAAIEAAGPSAKYGEFAENLVNAINALLAEGGEK